MTDVVGFSADKTTSLMQSLINLQLRTPEQKPMVPYLCPEAIDSPKPEDCAPISREVGRRFRRKAQHPYRSAIACDLFKVMRPTLLGLLTEGGHDSDFVSTPEETPKKADDASRPRRAGARRREATKDGDAAAANLANQARRSRRPPERFRFTTGSSSEFEEEQENAIDMDSPSSEDAVETEPLPPVRKASDASESVDPVRKRSGKSSGAANFYADGQRKVCASCHTRSTPYWRDGWGGVCLCNACGIRYKKRRIVCGDCSYVPRKEERSGPCPRCGCALVDKP